MNNNNSNNLYLKSTVLKCFTQGSTLNQQILKSNLKCSQMNSALSANAESYGTKKSEI